VGVVDEAVADGVGLRRVAENVVPLSDGELTRQDRGAGAVAILDELEQVAAIVRAQGIEPPIIDEQHVDARDSPGSRRAIPLRSNGLACGDCSLFASGLTVRRTAEKSPVVGRGLMSGGC
jgi:hypothetical protein